jgi:abortive infection bacteriophage resistance protein
LKYEKPHLPYDEQLKLLANRGLRYSDQRAAIQALRSIGYYRLSAYTYVLRAPGEATADGTRPPRADAFVEGARFEDAVALCLFDQGLRLCLLDALQQIEVAMRVQIGYQLGKTDPFGHLRRTSLDSETCAQPGRDCDSGLDARIAANLGIRDRDLCTSG